MKISKFSSFYTPIFLSIILFSCEKDYLSENIISDQVDDSLEDYIYNTNDLSDYIYDQSKLHRFDIIISQENLNLINNDPTAEQYVDASFIFEVWIDRRYNQTNHLYYIYNLQVSHLLDQI